jgi:hypothetical protein
MKSSLNFFALNLIFIVLTTGAFSQDTLKTELFDMNSCVSIYFDQMTPVATSEEEMDQYIKETGNSEHCIELLKDFDFDSYSLAGINLNSGSCRVPLNLNCTTVRLDGEKEYVVHVAFDVPIEPCCARSSYDLWVKVPALPDGYRIQFEIHRNHL